jgi:23S rRNA G2445 N2-methylase RlmL
VCDLPGALNATAAFAMVSLATPAHDEEFVNVACGSGTLMIERLALGPAGSVVGFDVDPRALDCARANLEASGYAAGARLVLGDATHLPHEAGSVRTVVADLPFAMLMGAGTTNSQLYPALLQEAGRVLTPSGRLVAVTTQKHLMTRIIDEQKDLWRTLAVVSFTVPHERGYIGPSIFVLGRL